MKYKTLRKLHFSLLEILVSVGILSLLITTFSYLGYDALQEFRRRNGRKAFKEYLLSLHHKNALLENYLMVAIEQKGDTIEATLGGFIEAADTKDLYRTFYVGKLFDQDSKYAIAITPQALPKDSQLCSWIKKNDCALRFRKISTKAK